VQAPPAGKLPLRQVLPSVERRSLAIYDRLAGVLA